jgi:hypothetical protein
LARQRLHLSRAPACGRAWSNFGHCAADWRSLDCYWFFESEQFASPGYQTPPKLELFTNFDPARAWQQPFRNEHKDSMLNILFIDMFGDYWRYGIDHYAANNNLEWRRFRARFGIVAATLFLASYVAGIAALAAAMIRPTAAEDRLRSAERTALSVVFFVGILMLMIATLPGYAGEKLDITKWGYIAPFVPSFVIPPTHLVDQAPIGWAREIAPELTGHGPTWQV